MYLVFHTNRLQRYANNPLLGQEPKRPSSKVVNGELEQEVKRIIASRTNRSKLEYRVQQTSQDEDPTQYSTSNFKNCLVKLKEYYKTNLDQPGLLIQLD